MKAHLVKYVRVEDEQDNTIEVRIWQLPEPSKDKPHGYKYSLVYIVEGIRVIGYDNAEGKGDHRHYKGAERPYAFKSIDRLLSDFHRDIKKYIGGRP